MIYSVKTFNSLVLRLFHPFILPLCTPNWYSIQLMVFTAEKRCMYLVCILHVRYKMTKNGEYCAMFNVQNVYVIRSFSLNDSITVSHGNFEFWMPFKKKISRWNKWHTFFGLIQTFFNADIPPTIVRIVKCELRILLNCNSNNNTSDPKTRKLETIDIFHLQYSSFPILFNHCGSVECESLDYL